MAAGKVWQKTTPGEGNLLPAFSLFLYWFALAPYANRITVQGLSVNVTSSAFPAVEALDATAVSAAAEASPAAVRAIG